MSGPRESAVLAAVTAYLACRGDVFTWRNNTGSYSPRPGQYVVFGHRGSGDILGLLAPSGRFLSIECKRPTGGRLSEDQKKFRDRVLAAGGIYVVATSAADVEAALPPVSVSLGSGRVFPR